MYSYFSNVRILRNSPQYTIYFVLYCVKVHKNEKESFKRGKSIFFLVLLILSYTNFLDVNFVSSINLQPDSRQQNAPAIVNRFADDTATKVPVKQISLPDLSVPLQLGRREPFSLFIPKHRKLAARLIDIFLGLFSTLFILLYILRLIRILCYQIINFAFVSSDFKSSRMYICRALIFFFCGR